MSLVLWRRKADNEHSNPLFYCPSTLNSQHLHFQFTVASLLKIFVTSRCDWEKKLPGRIPTGSNPHCLYNSTIPALLSSWGVEGGTPLQQLPGFDSFPPHVFKMHLADTGGHHHHGRRTGQGAGEQPWAHKFLNLCV